MKRVLKIVIGLALVGYAVYSGNSWFYLGLLPLAVGLTNWCPMEKLMGGCKDGNCSSGSCGSSDENANKESSCCPTVDDQVAQFTATQAEEKRSCCATAENKDNKSSKTFTGFSQNKIEILGTGCPKCIALEKIVNEALSQMNLNIPVVKVSDINEIMKYHVVSTPGLVINGEVKSTGKLLNAEEVKALINNAQKINNS